jgi:hypothetical protein
VRRQCHQVDVDVVQLQGKPAGGLDGIGVKEHAPLAAYAADLDHGLYSADLVVGEHHAHQDGIGTDGGCYLVGVDAPIFIHVHRGDLKAKHVAQLVKGVAYGVMLDGGRHKVIAVPASARGPGRAPQRQVVRLAARAGEHDLGGMASQYVGNGSPGLLQRVRGRPAESVG